MNYYLNNNISYDNFINFINSKYIVDKTNIIKILNERINTTQRYVCITRPRRFGKTSIVDMLGTYYGKNNNAKYLFDNLNISNDSFYEKHLNKYNVIRIDFSKLPDEICTYEEYIANIKNLLSIDLEKSYTDVNFSECGAIYNKFLATSDKFVFIIDEWDYIFNANMFTENHEDFLNFLRQLLKDQPYVSLCYMTGILPIKKHSTASALNMFDEFTILNDGVFDDFFGFLEEEVANLCKNQDKLSIKDIREWYNGYFTEYGYKVYNPRSVVKALEIGKCRSYWTNTGKMDEVLEYLKYDIYGVRDDVIKMINGEEIDIDINEEYRAGQSDPETVEQIYSAMIVLGFLSYFEGTIKIPNKELMKEFRNALKDKSFGEVSKIVNNSKKMLKATQNEDTQTVVEILHDIHNAEIPILKYNDENSLSCVITLAYLSARDTYKIDREEKSGKGYVDFCFRPKRKKDLPIILELKKDESVDVALKQIKEKEYATKFKNEYNDRELLIVAICYNSKTKDHTCKIQKI